MADFFSRIAERALGVASTVRPNLPPMFAPAPMIETSELLTTQFSPPADHAVDRNVKSDHGSAAASAQSPLSAGQERQQRTVASGTKPPLIPVDARGEPGMLRPDGAKPEFCDPVRVIPAPSHAPASNLETVAAHHSAGPTVQVTIGRVEVRAVMPPVQTPRAIERKSPQLFSLEEYLRERNGRHR